MRLFLLGPSFHGQGRFEIDGKDAHYLVDVLRLPIGQTITARDSQASLWTLRLLEIHKGSCTVEATACQQVKETTDALPEYQELGEIVLYQCVTKPKKLEQIVRQATEIGTLRIVPVISHFSCRETFKDDRLESQKREAIQQSGSLVPTRIDSPIPISEVPSNWASKGKALFFHQTSLPDQRHLGDILETLTPPVAILIGPEGGLDDNECTLLRNGGFEPVLLDTNILRAETAAVYALSVVQASIQKSIVDKKM